MFSVIFALILVSVGFVAGYGVRALISRKRRAASREMWRRRLEQDALAMKLNTRRFS
jgi:hypothetical protein